MADDILKLAGRIFIAAFFFMILADMATLPSIPMGKLKSLGLPYEGVFYAIVMVLIAFSSAAIAIGYKAKEGALILLIGFVAATVLFTMDLSYAGGVKKAIREAAVAGGLCFIYATHPGKYHVKI